MKEPNEQSPEALSRLDFFLLIGAHEYDANANIIWDTLQLHNYTIVKLPEDDLEQMDIKFSEAAKKIIQGTAAKNLTVVNKDLIAENASLRQQLVEHKKLIAELIPIAEHAQFSASMSPLISDQYMESVIKEVIARAKALTNKTE